MRPLELISHSPQETFEVGKAIGSLLKGGEVIALVGELGSGKTLFVKGLAEGEGVRNAKKAVKSPTFVLVHEYQGRHLLYHLDLFRIEDPRGLFQIGLEDFLRGDSVVVIEWGVKFPKELPTQRIEIDFEILNPKERSISISAEGSDYAWFIKKLGVKLTRFVVK